MLWALPSTGRTDLSSRPNKGLQRHKQPPSSPAASLRQASPIARRSTAAAYAPVFRDRRRARVSVPVWLAVLPDQLPVIGLVGCYPANYLIGRGPLRKRVRRPFGPLPCGNEQHGGLPLLSEGYPPLSGRLPTRYSAVRRFAYGLVLRAVESVSLAREYLLPAPALAGTKGTSGCHRRDHPARSTTPRGRSTCMC